MGIVIGILAIIVGIANLVFAIMVLIKLFQKEGTLKGILGIICMLYTFIWGWMHANELGIKQTMMIWTGLIILSMILNGIAQSINASQLMSGGESLRLLLIPMG